MEFKALDSYFTYMMSKPFGSFTPMGLTQYGPMLGIVLDCQEYFQTELFIIPKDIQLIEYHSHPNVDVYQMHVSGDFIFESNGLQYKNSNEIKSLNQKLMSNDAIAYVPAGTVHGLLVNGASSFMTFQYWKNGSKPESVGNDFVLDINNPNHSKGLKGLDRKDIPGVILKYDD